MLSKSQIKSFKEAYGDEESRHLRNESQINIGIPFQLRAMREMRGWTQHELAEKLGTTQNTISRLESSKAHAPNASTLLRLAAAFDVALLVRFAPFSDFYEFNTRATQKSVAVPNYCDDLADLEQETKKQTSQTPILGIDQTAPTLVEFQDAFKVLGLSPGITPRDQCSYSAERLSGMETVILAQPEKAFSEPAQNLRSCEEGKGIHLVGQKKTVQQAFDGINSQVDPFKQVTKTVLVA